MTPIGSLLPTSRLSFLSVLAPHGLCVTVSPSLQTLGRHPLAELPSEGPDGLLQCAVTYAF